MEKHENILKNLGIDYDTTPSAIVFEFCKTFEVILILRKINIPIIGIDLWIKKNGFYNILELKDEVLVLYIPDRFNSSLSFKIAADFLLFVIEKTEIDIYSTYCEVSISDKIIS